MGCIGKVLVGGNFGILWAKGQGGGVLECWKAVRAALAKQRKSERVRSGTKGNETGEKNEFWKNEPNFNDEVLDCNMLWVVKWLLQNEPISNPFWMIRNWLPG